MYHASHFIRHTSHVTRHTSHVTRPSGDYPIRFFIEPIILTINHALSLGYKHVVLTGLSGTRPQPFHYHWFSVLIS